MIMSSLNIQVAGLYQPIECSIIVNVLHIFVFCPDDDMHSQAETGVSKAVLYQFVPKEQLLPDYQLPQRKPVHKQNFTKYGPTPKQNVSYRQSTSYPSANCTQQ
jgi:hypothetical protein